MSIKTCWPDPTVWKTPQARTLCGLKFRGAKAANLAGERDRVNCRDCRRLGGMMKPCPACGYEDHEVCKLIGHTYPIKDPAE